LRCRRRLPNVRSPTVESDATDRSN